MEAWLPLTYHLVEGMQELSQNGSSLFKQAIGSILLTFPCNNLCELVSSSYYGPSKLGYSYFFCLTLIWVLWYPWSTLFRFMLLHKSKANERLFRLMNLQENQANSLVHIPKSKGINPKIQLNKWMKQCLILWTFPLC